MPMLYALTSQDAKNGGYYGPSGIGERKGLPGIVRVPEQAVNGDLPKILWSISEDLASVSIAI